MKTKIIEYKYQKIFFDEIDNEYSCEGDGLYLSNFISLESIKKEIDAYLNGEFGWDK